MIPINIDDPLVLRRTLEDIEARIIIHDTPLSPVPPLLESDKLGDAIIRINEIADALNLVITRLNEQSASTLS